MIKRIVIILFLLLIPSIGICQVDCSSFHTYTMMAEENNCLAVPSCLNLKVGKAYTCGIKNVPGYHEIKVLSKHRYAVKIDKWLGIEGQRPLTNWFRLTDFYDIVEIKKSK